jgi:hypothetical protein
MTQPAPPFVLVHGVTRAAAGRPREHHLVVVAIPSGAALARHVRAVCSDAGQPPPHGATITSLRALGLEPRTITLEELPSALEHPWLSPRTRDTIIDAAGSLAWPVPGMGEEV